MGDVPDNDTRKGYTMKCFYKDTRAMFAGIASDIVLNGGGTYRIQWSGADVNIAEVPELGVAVGGAGVSWVQREAFTGPQIGDFVRGQDDIVETFGAWQDSATGKWWLDAVEVVTAPEGVLDAHGQIALHYAVKLGQQRGELAVWDLQHSREVRLDRPMPLEVLIGAPVAYPERAEDLKA